MQANTSEDVLNRRILTPPIKIEDDFVADMQPQVAFEGGAEPKPRPEPVAVPDVPKPDVDRRSPSGGERRSGDRRQRQDPNYAGPERRNGDRRSMDNLRNDLNWQLAPEVENKILRGMGLNGSRRSTFKPARIILLLVALIAGGLAAFLVTQRDSEIVEQPQMVLAPEPVAVVLPKILVAKQTIGMGQRLSPDQVEWQDWPTDLVRQDYITFQDNPEAIEDLGGTMTRFEFFAGEPIREQKLARNAGGYLSAVISKGMRGVSLSVAGEAASGGFIVPNDRVDIVLTRDAPQGQVSETILRNIRVLAMNARVGELGEAGEQAERDDLLAEMLEDKVIATLELDPAEAEIIVGATNVGTFALVLRSMTDFAESRSRSRSGVNQTIRLTSPFWNQSSEPNALR
ncbi:MAG: pilus assembly protein CpaB [Maritalea sp.]